MCYLEMCMLLINRSAVVLDVRLCSLVNNYRCVGDMEKGALVSCTFYNMKCIIVPQSTHTKKMAKLSCTAAFRKLAG
jgi:hypothetical protein